MKRDIDTACARVEYAYVRVCACVYARAFLYVWGAYGGNLSLGMDRYPLAKIHHILIITFHNIHNSY
jgi:hypothetical protein